MKGQETYAQLQECAAAAINQLLVDDYLPVDRHAVTQVMACREAAHSALIERIELLGWRPQWVSASPGPKADQPGAPLFLLGEVLSGLPRQLPEDRVSPLDALTTVTTDPGREEWRRAARALMQGTHALSTAVRRPWLDDRGAAWFVIADCSTTLEALLVLDERLAEVGLLSAHGPGRGSVMPGAEARMRLSHCGHVATCNATNDQPDLAVAHCAEVDRPVRIVRQPSDLIDAQRQLASLVRPLRRAWEGSALERMPHINLATARNVLFGQLDLCHRMDGLCRRAGGMGELERFFAGQGDALRRLLPALPRLTELRPVEGRPLVVWQQQEITLGLRHLEYSRGELDASQVRALGMATHTAISAFAATFRKEIRARGSNITSTRQDDETQLRADIRDTPLDRALAALSQAASPAGLARGDRQAQRSLLLSTLRRTPSGDSYAVSPFVHRRTTNRHAVGGSIQR